MSDKEPKKDDLQNQTITNSDPPVVTPDYTAYQDMINKAKETVRIEEKNKLYGKIQEKEAELNKAEQIKTELLNEQKRLQDEILKLQNEKNTQSKSVEEQLKEIQAQNLELQKKLQDQEIETQQKITIVSDQAAQMIHESELKGYREKKIVETGVVLTEFVKGNTTEEIDESIKLALARQKEIEDNAAKQLQNTMSKNVPKPLAPTNEDQNIPNDLLKSPGFREKLMKGKRENYEKIREELLKRAEESTGWKRNREINT